ncbi:hypothetical protein ACRDNQ_14240 [Palleronia sp. KMU-117]|uniref:hypothetical protein n=1 Tax=Palleronia sp. KMU-117 TaxID=3434108 RepID=UPI003D743E45
MAPRDPLFLFGLSLAVVVDVLLVYIVFGLPGVVIGALICHLLVGRIERRRRETLPASADAAFGRGR